MSLADIGTVIRVLPWDDIFHVTSETSAVSICDRLPFYFRVEEQLFDGQIFYGLCGPVLGEHALYAGLVCSVVVRADETDWRKTSCCEARFKIGPVKVCRDHQFDFRHPDGTRVRQYPFFSSIGEIIEEAAADL